MNALITPGAGAAVMADQYTRELGDYCKRQLPITLSNDEYTTRISALIVGLTRMLAEYVVCSADVHGCEIGELADLTGRQFVRNVLQAQSVINAEGATRQ